MSLQIFKERQNKYFEERNSLLSHNKNTFSFYGKGVFVVVYFSLSGEEIPVVRNCNNSTSSIALKPEDSKTWHRCSSTNRNTV